MGIQFTPLFDRILVKPISSEETVGGLFIPDTSNNLKKGKVVAVGLTEVVEVGQEILFAKGDGTEITLDGEQFLIMKENSVWLIKSELEFN